MKTSVELNDEKVLLAKRLSPSTRTLRELLDRALDSLIAQSRRQALAEQLGTPFFDGSLDTMRERKGASRR